MWREEVGCFEMLLAFYKENVLDDNKSYRDFLFDLLECYEERSCSNRGDSERPSSRKRRRVSEATGEDIAVSKQPTSRTKPGPASKTRSGQSAGKPSRREELSEEESSESVDTVPPPNGDSSAVNKSSSSSSSLIKSSSRPQPPPLPSSFSSRREKTTPLGRAADNNVSKSYIRLPDQPRSTVGPLPLPTLASASSRTGSLTKILPAPSTSKAAALPSSRGALPRTIAPNPAQFLGNVGKLGEMFGNKDFDGGFPCILCSQTFRSEEVYQQHGCFAQTEMLESFKCRCCPLSFPTDHRRLRHERNVHGLNA